jgi:hypothetical protein
MRHPFAVGLVMIGAVSCRSSEAREKPTEPTRHFASNSYNHTTTQIVSRTAHTVGGYVAESEGDTVRYNARLTKDGFVEYIDVTVQPSSRRGEAAQSRRITMNEGTFPMIGDAVGLLEQIIRRARSVGGDEVSVPVMHIGPRAEFTSIKITKIDADSVLLSDFEGGPSAGVHLAVDAQGRILGGIVPISKGRIWRDDDEQ